MALTKVTGKGITCSAVTEAKIGTSAVTTAKINADAVTSAKIQDGQVTADDLASTLDLSSKTVTLPGSATSTIDQNIALLGFKMAVNDGLTVFNLVDGVVDEFNDESGTDESEGSNDNYCGTDDYYTNVGSPVSISAGFTTSSITEPDTSTTGTNPAFGSGTSGVFTVPSGMTSATIQVWGSGGGRTTSGEGVNPSSGSGGGGYAAGTLAITPGQSLYVLAGEGGTTTYCAPNPGCVSAFFQGGGKFWAGCYGAGGGGLAGVFSSDLVPLSAPQQSAPLAFIVAGSGGGSGQDQNPGGAGGGTTGKAAGGGITTGNPATTSNSGSLEAGGGDQEQGGQGGCGTPGCKQGQPGGLFVGGGAGVASGTGGAGFYGGGGGGRSDPQSADGSGGGGSSYYAHPQITSGSTSAGQAFTGGGTGQPNYVPGTNEGSVRSADPSGTGEDGYVLLTGTADGSTTSTTIVSTAFTSTSVASTARIVVFEENVDTPTLNTDIIASVSRDAGVTFTNATLTDSGYVTGSSGQRILTGQADISGQPSGQSMRWKLALANNQVKIHGVALQWS